MREIRGPLRAPDRAAADLAAARQAWDPEAAERAVASLARSRSGGEVFSMLWRYSARDYRNIRHKAIFVGTSACRARSGHLRPGKVKFRMVHDTSRAVAQI